MKKHTRRLMDLLSTTEELAAFCAKCKNFPYVTIDTEFLRERSYYSKLCLVQLAHPAKGDAGAILVDTLSPDIDLAPLYDLFADTSVMKVFHAARQDLEIFFVDKGVFPKPFFDTQVAAMVCGFGEQVGYETLVRKIAKEPLDKSSRFTDWSARPLSEKQMVYALGDVTHLRVIYEFLSKKLHETGRMAWVEEELETLLNPETYAAVPENAWKRVKTRNNSGKLLSIVKELAQFRESYAQTKDVPRSRVYKDDALMELAATKPQSYAELGKSRLLLREARRGEIADGIIASVKRGMAYKPDQYPKPVAQRQRPQGNEGLADLLRVLLKAKSEDAGVAQKLIATTSDLEDLAAGYTDTIIYRGWRNDVFGNDAKRLCAGEIALSAQGSRVKIVEIK